MLRLVGPALGRCDQRAVDLTNAGGAPGTRAGRHRPTTETRHNDAGRDHRPLKGVHSGSGRVGCYREYMVVPKNLSATPCRPSRSAFTSTSRRMQARIHAYPDDAGSIPARSIHGPRSGSSTAERDCLATPCYRVVSGRSSAWQSACLGCTRPGVRIFPPRLDERPGHSTSQRMPPGVHPALAGSTPACRAILGRTLGFTRRCEDSVAQLAEAAVLETACCRFESCRSHNNWIDGECARNSMRIGCPYGRAGSIPASPGAGGVAEWQTRSVKCFWHPLSPSSL